MRFILGLIWKYQKFQISWLKNLLNLVRTMQQWMKQKRGKIKAEWLFCVLQAFIFPLNTTQLALVLTIMHISTENQPHFVICNIKHYSYYTTAMINHRLKSATVSFYFEKFNPYWMVLKHELTLHISACTTASDCTEHCALFGNQHCVDGHCHCPFDNVLPGGRK